MPAGRDETTDDPAAGRSSLRPLVPSDATAMARWALDEEFCVAAEWSTELGFDGQLAFHRGIIADPPDGLLRLGLVHDDELVGYVDLHGTEEHSRELGFLIGPGRWGHGLGTAAAGLGIRHGFALGLREIWAEALDANQRSVRILHRVGMVETGRGVEAAYLGEPSFYRRFAIGQSARTAASSTSSPSESRSSPMTNGGSNRMTLL